MPLRPPAAGAREAGTREAGSPLRRGPGRRAVIAASATLMLPALASPLAARAIAAATLAEQDGTTRLTLRTGAPVAFRLFTLKNPWRLVIDLEQAPWRAGAVPAGPSIMGSQVAGNCAAGVEREISASSGVMSAGMLANSGVLR